MPGIFIDAGRTTAIVMLLVAVSTALSFVMSFARIPDIILGATDNKVAVLLIAGTFMYLTPAILIFVPTFLPIARELRVDPVHFGAIIVMNLSLGVITPPVGNVLFVGAIIPQLRIEPVIRKVRPSLIAIAVALFLVVFIPELSLWPPKAMGLIAG